MLDDDRIRAAAFTHVRRLKAIHGPLSHEQIRLGFQLDGVRLPLVNPQRGIFKPQQARFLLSIRTVFPMPGRRVWYDDQHEVHRQLYAGDETVDYAFMGRDPDAADNRWLREALEHRVPLIYFLGIAPGLDEAILPVFIAGWSRETLKARVAFGVPEQAGERVPDTAGDRRYAMRAVKQRLHHCQFRIAVIDAYDGLCALSGLPERRLLDAAHIIEDGHETLGQPVVRNGLPLSKIHHAAFDADLIGIDADLRVHVSPRLLEQRDGPMLDALQRLGGATIRLPRRTQDQPDRDRLAARFERFRLSL